MNRLSIVVLCAISSTQANAASANPRPYYEGKTIQLIVAFAPGGVTDNSARLVGRYLGKYVLATRHDRAKHAGASGIIAANFLTASPSATVLRLRPWAAAIIWNKWSESRRSVRSRKFS